MDLHRQQEGACLQDDLVNHGSSQANSIAANSLLLLYAGV
jgi:hypothetical protein